MTGSSSIAQFPRPEVELGSGHLLKPVAQFQKKKSPTEHKSLSVSRVWNKLLPYFPWLLEKKIDQNHPFQEQCLISKSFAEKKYSDASAFAYCDEILKLVGFKFLDEVSPPSEVQHKLDNYFKFLEVRDPWTRLLSAYRDNFEKNNSFYNYYGRLILGKYRENQSKWLP